MAREGYLVNAGEDTIHAGEVKPETPRQKRQNWWFYHKVYVIVALVAIVILGSFVYSVATKVEADYTVALMTSYTMPDEGLEQLKECISPYAYDRNGDGKVSVTVTNYVFSQSSSDYQQMQASLTKFVADCTTNETILYLHDEAAFDMMTGYFDGLFQYNDGSPMPEGASDYENAMLSWDSFKAFSSFEPTVPEDSEWDADILTQLYEKLRVSVRTSADSSMEKDEEDMAYYKDSLELFNKLKTGETA